MKNLLMICFLGSAMSAAAQETAPPQHEAPWFVQRFKLTAGYFMAANNTGVQLSNNELLGTRVNLEDDLGFRNNVHTLLANAQWRASARSRFDFSYYRLHRSATHQLQRTIQFGDNTYNVNATTDAYFNSDIYRISYGYAIFQGPKYEAGLMVGAHVVRSQMGLALTGDQAELNVNDHFDVTAPLPNVGVWGGFAFSSRWAINGDLSYMSLSINDVNGSILTGSAGLSFRIVDGLSVSAAYMGLHLQLDGEHDGLLGDVDWRFKGPLLSLSYSFGNRRWTTQ